MSASSLLKSVCAALILSLGLTMTASPIVLRAQDDPEMMEDMCAGDMLWMIGWCLDMVMPGDSVEVSNLALSSEARHYEGEFESINVAGAVATRAFGINPQGDIVGSYTAGGKTHGFLLRDGVVTTIDYPGSTSTEAWGINARGDIIGRYTVAGRGGALGFFLRDGHYTDISVPNPSRPDGKHLITLPTKIGSSGEVVGCYHDIDNVTDMFGYVQRGSDVSSFAVQTTLSGGRTGFSAMHNGVSPGGRTVVGFTALPGGRSRGYAITGGQFSYLDFPSSVSTQAWDVNTTGAIVGQYDGAGRIHGFLLAADGYVSLDVPNSTMTVARGINPRGDIVGVYNDAAGAHGFVLRR